MDGKFAFFVDFFLILSFFVLKGPLGLLVAPVICIFLAFRVLFGTSEVMLECGNSFCAYFAGGEVMVFCAICLWLRIGRMVMVCRLLWVISGIALVGK